VSDEIPAFVLDHPPMYPDPNETPAEDDAFRAEALALVEDMDGYGKLSPACYAPSAARARLPRRSRLAIPGDDVNRFVVWRHGDGLLLASCCLFDTASLHD
jgi:hypothetical protein